MKTKGMVYYKKKIHRSIKEKMEASMLVKIFFLKRKADIYQKLENQVKNSIQLFLTNICLNILKYQYRYM